MPTSIRDLLSLVPHPYPTGVIPYRDGCDRTVIEIPAGITCEDVKRCIDCEFIAGLFTFDESIFVSGCNIQVDPNRLQGAIVASFECNAGTPLLSIGSTLLDMSCIYDSIFFNLVDNSTNQTVLNQGTITLNGRDGINVRLGNGGINVSLPNPRLPGQVLTWNGDTNQAYRANPLTICCDQIQACMAPLIQGLQNQINILASQLCPCSAGEGGSLIDIYRENALIHANVQQLNFLGECVEVVWNAVTSQADVTINCSPTGIIHGEECPEGVVPSFMIGTIYFDESDPDAVLMYYSTKGSIDSPSLIGWMLVQATPANCGGQPV